MKVVTGKYRNIKRLKNALVTNASLDQIDEFKINYDTFKKSTNINHVGNIKCLLIDIAIRNISRNVADVLINDGAICNYAQCIYDCEYRKLEDVYNYILEMVEEHGSFTKNTVHLHKGMIIKRLIDPDKVMVNKDRILYIIDLIGSGFITAGEVKEIADTLYKSDKYKGEFKMMYRELLLTELGIK